jgi:hypothetical protein
MTKKIDRDSRRKQEHLDNLRRLRERFVYIWFVELTFNWRHPNVLNRGFWINQNEQSNHRDNRKRDQITKSIVIQ